MTTRTQVIHVEVDLDDFDDDEIAEEYESRGLGGSDLADCIEEMFYAFKLGEEDRAMQLAKQIDQEQTGRIL